MTGNEVGKAAALQALDRRQKEVVALEERLSKERAKLAGQQKVVERLERGRERVLAELERATERVTQFLVTQSPRTEEGDDGSPDLG